MTPIISVCFYELILMSNLKDIQDASDTIVASSSVKWGMGGGAATSIFGSFSNNDLLVIVGVVTTALGFVVNFYYQYRRNKRAEEEHQLQKELLEKQIQNEEKNSSH